MTLLNTMPIIRLLALEVGYQYLPVQLPVYTLINVMKMCVSECIQYDALIDLKYIRD